MNYKNIYIEFSEDLNETDFNKIVKILADNGVPSYNKDHYRDFVREKAGIKTDYEDWWLSHSAEASSERFEPHYFLSLHDKPQQVVPSTFNGVDEIFDMI